AAVQESDRAEVDTASSMRTSPSLCRLVTQLLRWIEGAGSRTRMPRARPVARSARRHRDGLHEVLHHVVADLVAHVATDLGREAPVEARPEARLGHLVDEDAR